MTPTRAYSRIADALESATGTSTTALTRTDRAALLTALLVIVDGLMSIPFWHLEGNGLLLSQGPTWMLATKTAGVVFMLALYWLWPGVRASTVSKACVWSLTALYAFVVASNLAVLAVAGI